MLVAFTLRHASAVTSETSSHFASVDKKHEMFRIDLSALNKGNVRRLRLRGGGGRPEDPGSHECLQVRRVRWPHVHWEWVAETVSRSTLTLGPLALLWLAEKLLVNAQAGQFPVVVNAQGKCVKVGGLETELPAPLRMACRSRTHAVDLSVCRSVGLSVCRSVDLSRSVEIC